MLQACLFLLAGVYALQLSSFTPDSGPIAVALLVIAGGLLFGMFRAVLIFAAGVLLFQLAAIGVVSSRIAADFVGDSIVTQARIINFPQRKGATVSLFAEVPDSPWVPRRIRISWYEPGVEVRLGDLWQLELRLRRPRGNSNPGVFDYESWLFRERIAAIGYVVDGPRNRLLHSGELGAIERLRQRVVDRVGTIIPDVEQAAVIMAISVGARHLITPEQWQRYARTGTSHLMAISGLHVSLAAAGGYFLVTLIAGLLRSRSNQHFVATAAALVVALAYALISGLAVPAQRASLMIGIGVIAILWRRQMQPFAIIAAACVVITVMTPLATMAPGFKLSFAAVLVLAWLAQRLPGRIAARGLLRPLFAFQQLGAAQLVLLFGLLPLTVLIFARISIAAPAINLIAVPVFSLVTVPFTLAGLLLDGFLQPLGDGALVVAAASLGFIESLIAMAAPIPAASVTLPSVSGMAWLYLLVPAAWVVCPPGWPCRGVAWVAAIALSLHLPARPPSACADIEVLDVGQGLAIVVETRRHVVVFDTGPAFRGGGDAAKSVVLPYLTARGLNRVDKLVVSHADLDHAGGVESLLAAVNVPDIRVGEQLAGEQQLSEECVAGHSWRYDGIRFEFLHPQAGSARDGNDSSCVLLVTAGEFRALLTGDIEQPVEEELVRSGKLQAVDVVVVPHHGSQTSSSMPFVSALRPAVAIVSAGFGNRWGFPKQEVVGHWQAAGAEVITTATAGAVRLRLCEEGGIMALSRQRVRQRRIWND